MSQATLKTMEELLEILAARGASVRTITIHPDGKIEITLGPDVEPNALDLWRRQHKSYRES